MEMSRCLIFAVVLTLPLLAGAGEELTPHERELLLARLEDLAGRMAAAQNDQIPTEMRSRHARLKVELRLERKRTLTGVTLEKTAVTLKGGPELILAWLGKLKESRIALTPPFSLRALGAGFELQLSAWRVQGNRPDPKVSDDELFKLKENLEWFEKRREKLAGYIGFLQPLLDVEAVFVSAARLEQDAVSLTAEACDRGSKEAFIKELALRAARISKSIRLDWEGLKVRSAKVVKGRGLHMRDLEPADALLLGCEVEQAQVIAAWKKGAPLTGRIPDKKEGLLPQLLRKLELSTQKLGTVMVASDRLKGKPPGAEMLPKRPITLQLRKVSPQNLFVLLSEVFRVGVIPPASDRTLTILVRNMPVRNLAAGALWALELVPNGDDKIMVALPPGVAPAIRKGEAGGLDLSAAEAPLSLLVDALAGRPGVIACGEDPLLTLRVRDVSDKNLLSLLLSGRGKTLKQSGGKTYLVPTGTGADLKNCLTDKKPATVDRLYAVIRGKKESLALLNDGGHLRWVAEGEKLKDGRELRRIRTSRAVLRGPDRKLTSLFPDAGPDCPPAGCSRRFDPTATPLARFRLAGTAVSGKRAAAALVDGEGHVYLIRKDQLLGRRCGRVVEVVAGRIKVEMGCGQRYDSKVVWISLRPD